MEDKIFTKEIDVNRERIISEIWRIKETQRDKSVSQDSVLKLFNKAAFVSNKANLIASKITEEASKFIIPIEDDATEVRAATRRKSVDSVDSYITFDLFKDAVDAMNLIKKESEEIILVSRSSMSESVLRKKIVKTRARISLAKSGKVPDENLLEMLVSQFMILWMAHRLMQPFEALLEHLPLSQTWVEKEGGLSEAEIALSVLIGVAAQLLIMELNDEIMETYLEEAAGGKFPNGFTAKTIIAQARTLPKTRESDLMEAQMGLHDYEIILAYAFDFLKRTTESGYEMWIAYIDTVNIRYNAQSLWVQAPHYSVHHTVNNQKFTKKKNRRRFDDDQSEDRAHKELQRAVLNNLIPMADVGYLTRLNALEESDETLDTIAQVLSTDLSHEVICCFARFVGKLPVKTLRVIRAFMKGLLRAYAFDFKNVLDAIYAHLVSPNFQEIIALEAMQYIDEIFGKLVGKLLGLFDDEMETVLCCPFIGEMINVVLEVIVRLENELRNAVYIYAGKLTKEIGIGTIDVKRRYAYVYDSRLLRKMILVIDKILALGQTASSCEKGDIISPLPEVIRGGISLPVLYFDDDEKNNFFLNTTEKELITGKFLPDVGDKIESLVRDAIATAENRIKGGHACGFSLSEESLNQAISGFTI